MSTESVILRFRMVSEKLRAAETSGPDGDMDKYINGIVADAYDIVCNALEEDIRQSQRYHQEPT